MQSEHVNSSRIETKVGWGTWTRSSRREGNSWNAKQWKVAELVSRFLFSQETKRTKNEKHQSETGHALQQLIAAIHQHVLLLDQRQLSSTSTAAKPQEILPLSIESYWTHHVWGAWLVECGGLSLLPWLQRAALRVAIFLHSHRCSEDTTSSNSGGTAATSPEVRCTVESEVVNTFNHFLKSSDQVVDEDRWQVWQGMNISTYFTTKVG